MSFLHKDLARGKWNELTLMQQLANVGSEVGRAINWKNKGNKEYSNNAFERALELLDLTLADKKNKKRLKEVARVREGLVDYFFNGNFYNFTDEWWEKYFLGFNYAAVNHDSRVA